MSAPILCGWCGVLPSVTTVYCTPTCELCAQGRGERIARYHERLQRSATRQGEKP